ncbi:hypothetical protein [Streptomyces sp. NK15101]|uniref:hypothetical protein n=1 Tax=Streptomyces sp. NK15101 TaxID=2873261 RepID=UPI001CECEE38|nr:hypothetical protein [Streptomyces sp. NK15101]
MSSEIPARPEPGDVVVGVDGAPSARTAALRTAVEADHRSRPPRVAHALIRRSHRPVEAVPSGFTTRDEEP